jgi:hypothetical protein
MENNENFMPNEAENVVQPTEEVAQETAKVFTQEEMNAAVGKAKARERAKVTKQYERQYGDLIDVLRTGTGEDDLGKITDSFREHYEKRGVQFRQPSYSDRDLAVLANAEAQDIISGGYEDVVEEVDRLAAKGVANMNAREKVMFETLAKYRHQEERSQALSRIGVTEDVYNSKEFAEFASMFNPNTPIDKVFSLYRQEKQPNKNYQTMGSMKNHESGDNGVKDFYSVEEARKFTKEDFDKNPALYEAVQKSAQRWR